MQVFQNRESEEDSSSSSITTTFKTSNIWCNNLSSVLYCETFDTTTFYYRCIFILVYKAFCRLFCRLCVCVWC